MLDLDIDKLHNCVQKINQCEYLPPNSGTTTAYLNLMIGEVWLGNPHNQYVYIGNDRGHVKNICLDFIVLLHMDQLTSEFSKKNIQVIYQNNYHHVLVNEQLFLFIDCIKANDPKFWIGKDINRVFIDINEYRPRVKQNILDTIIAHGGDIL